MAKGGEGREHLILSLQLNSKLIMIELSKKCFAYSI